MQRPSMADGSDKSMVVGGSGVSTTATSMPPATTQRLGTLPVTFLPLRAAAVALPPTNDAAEKKRKKKAKKKNCGVAFWEEKTTAATTDHYATK